jgi:hypothetical protein
MNGMTSVLQLTSSISQIRLAPSFSSHSSSKVMLSSSPPSQPSLIRNITNSFIGTSNRTSVVNTSNHISDALKIGKKIDPSYLLEYEVSDILHEIELDYLTNIFIEKRYNSVFQLLLCNLNQDDFIYLGILSIEIQQLLNRTLNDLKLYYVNATCK